MKLNLSELRRLIVIMELNLRSSQSLQLLNIAEAAKRQQEQGELIRAFVVADEGTVGEFSELTRKNTELSNVVRELLEDVEIGE